MKTSNKLLIALAVSLIIIPIIVVAVTVKMKYTDAKSMNADNKSIDSFTTPTVGYIGTEIPKPFTTINVEEAKDMYLNIRLIKGAKSGIKVSEDFKDRFSFKVDENGILQLNFKELKKGNNSYSSLIIYAPNINQLSMLKGRGLSLTANADSLLLNANSLTELSVGSESKINNIIAVADGVSRVNLGNNASIGSVNLSLKNSNFSSEQSSYKSLKIVASGHSNIEISGQEPEKSKYQIDELYIKTTGKTDLKLENIKVNKSSGSLSDSTSVNMSASILKTMFNK